LNIFISVNDIINIQMDEFNERLEQYKGGVPFSSLLGPPDPTKTQFIQDPRPKAKMTEEQAVLAREIRRRGKNENAAQDCRRRANGRISRLKNDLERERLMKEQKRQESAQLAQQLRHLEEKNRQQDNTIMRHFNLPPEGYMLVDDLSTGKVKIERIPEEINRPVGSFESYERVPPPRLRLKLRLRKEQKRQELAKLPQQLRHLNIGTLDHLDI